MPKVSEFDQLCLASAPMTGHFQTPDGISSGETVKVFTQICLGQVSLDITDSDGHCVTVFLTPEQATVLGGSLVGLAPLCPEYADYI